jgi:transposase
VGRPSRYPDEFWHEAVQMALAAQDSRASVARRLGINETTLRNWVANHLAEEARQANPLAVSPSEFEELRRLRREAGELRAEKEILGKAAAYFAQETIRSAASDSSPITVTPMASSGSAGSSGSPARGSAPSPAGPPSARQSAGAQLSQAITAIMRGPAAPTACRVCMPSVPGSACTAAASGLFA